LEHAVDSRLREAIQKHRVLPLIREEYRSLTLTPERRDQMLEELATVSW